MQTIGISKEFIDNLFIESDKDEFSIDLIKYLQKEVFDVRLICNLSSIDEYRYALDENPLWELLMDKYDKIKFNVNYETDIFNDNFYTKIEEQNIFFVSISDLSCEELTLNRGYIYVTSLNIEKTWGPIMDLRANSIYKVTCDSCFPSKLKFDCWSILERSLLPTTSIIIFDKYILRDRSNSRLSDNLFVLLKMLCSNEKLLKPITLTIISEFRSDSEVIASYSKIQEYFSINSINNAKLNIIRHDKGKYPSDFEGLHYRLVLTNNLRIKCDDSFNFFKSNGKVNNDADLHISFNQSIPYKHFYEKELKHLKRYITKISNVDDSLPLPDKIFVYLDKENYLLG